MIGSAIRWIGQAARVIAAGGACLTMAIATHSATADVVVASNANTSVSGASDQYGLMDSGPVTFQFAYSSSQFTGIGAGSAITGIGFRLPAGSSTFNADLVYSSFSIQIGQSTALPGALSTTFATNEASDTVTALSGPRTIAAGSLVGGSEPNPFLELTFTNAYTYTGGDILVTLRHSDPGQDGVINVDANYLPGQFSSPLPAGQADTVASFGSADATSGKEGFFNVPVTAFYFQPTTAVPEPSPLFLAAAAIVPMFGYMKFRVRRRAA